MDYLNNLQHTYDMTQGNTQQMNNNKTLIGKHMASLDYTCVSKKEIEY